MRIGFSLRTLPTWAFVFLLSGSAWAEEQVVVTSLEDVRELVADDVRSSVKVSPNAPDFESGKAANLAILKALAAKRCVDSLELSGYNGIGHVKEFEGLRSLKITTLSFHQNSQLFRDLCEVDGIRDIELWVVG